MKNVQNIINAPVLTPSKSPILYELSKSAMNCNSKLLKQHDYDISKLIDDFPGSDLSCGNEFRPVSILGPLLNKHPNWDSLQKYLSIGFNAEFKPISDSDRVKDMKEAIDRGNHKLALTHSDTLLSNVK